MQECSKQNLEAEGHVIISKGRTNIKYFVKDYETVLFDHPKLYVSILISLFV